MKKFNVNWSSLLQKNPFKGLSRKFFQKKNIELGPLEGQETPPDTLPDAPPDTLPGNFSFKYLVQDKIYKNNQDFFDNGKGDQLLCFSYLKAQDDYNDVTDAIRYSGYALSKNPKSYTYQMISALIYAQKVIYSDRCQVYKLTDEVRKNNSLIKDMKGEAISIIFEYMDLYKHDCPNL